MVSSIVHHQNHSFLRVLLHQQFFQKADEGGTVLRLGNRPGNRIVQPVVATKDMPFLLFTRSGGRDPFLLLLSSSNMPAGADPGLRSFRPQR